MDRIDIVFSRDALFRQSSDRLFSVSAAAGGDDGAIDALRMEREDADTFDMLVRSAHSRVKAGLAHLAAENSGDAVCHAVYDDMAMCPCAVSGFGGGMVVADGAIHYDLVLTHPMQRHLLPGAIERVLVLYVAEEWLRMRSVPMDLGLGRAWDELKSVALMCDRPPRRPYSYC